MEEQEPTPPGASETSNTTPSNEELKPTSKGVENAKKRLRAFSIQKKSLSPVTIPLPKPICPTVGAVGTVFIGKLASTKPTLKPGDIEEVVDPKKPPKPPKPGTSKQNVTYPLADYLNSQKKTLSEIEAMKRKMELVDLGIPLGLIGPATDGDKAMPTKAMPPIKSMMLDPAKVDEIIREAKKARAEGKPYKFSYEKLLPSYQNPFARKDKQKQIEKEREDDRPGRDRRRMSDNYRRYSGDNRARDRQSVDADRRRIIRERDEKLRKRRNDRSKADNKSKDRDKIKDGDAKSSEKTETSKEEAKPKNKDSKSKKMDTINLSDDDSVEFVANAKVAKEADVNLKDFVVCDSWSENEEKNREIGSRDEKGKTQSKTPKVIDPMDQLKQSLCKDKIDVKIEKLQPVTDSFKFEIEEENEEDGLDIFSENAAIADFAKIPLPSKKDPYSPLRFDYESKDASVDAMDESFLESVIAEIKQEDMDENATQDKGLVEYDISPKDDRVSVTPELDDKTRELYSSRSDYSDGFKSVESTKSIESGTKSVESGYKSSQSRSKSVDSNRSDSLSRSRQGDSQSRSIDSQKSIEGGYKSTESRKLKTDDGMSKSTVDSLETWSFVLKICQPLLFRHDRNKCYKETRSQPKIWYAENPKCCDCVKDRSVVYEELEMCKTELVDSVYRNDHIGGTACDTFRRAQDDPCPAARGWYPGSPLAARGPGPPACDWEADDSRERPTPPWREAGDTRGRPTPPRADRLHLEYQKFMEAVWPDVESQMKSETPPKTPTREVKKRPLEEPDTAKKKKVKVDLEKRMSSEGWSQDSEVEEEPKIKKTKIEKLRRKRKHSSTTDSDDESPSKRRKEKKKEKQKAKSALKRQRLSKKYLKKLKEKQEKQLKRKKKQSKIDQESDFDAKEKKTQKKLKKKKLLKQKRKALKKKKRTSSTSTSTSESDKKSKKKDKRKKRKKRKQSSSDSNQSDDVFDADILKNIKTERLTDDEVKNFSPKKHREIINVKQLQNDFVSIQIKKEVEDVNSPVAFEESLTEAEKRVIEDRDRKVERVAEVEAVEAKEEVSVEPPEVKTQSPTPQKPLDDTTQSSQESIISVKEYEKDDSHLRPSSQNSNYNFHDVMQSEGHVERPSHDYSKDNMEFTGNYEMYEQMAMEYQSDVASQRVPPPDETSGRIETVTLPRNRGEIKCDWRAGDPAEPRGSEAMRPSRWGLKPSEVNIVLTGGPDADVEAYAPPPAPAPAPSPAPPPAPAQVYKIQSLANRTDNSNSGYDEAYMDMYGASDRLQYGDCFARSPPAPAPPPHSSLDDRINLALRTTVLGEVAKDRTEPDDVPDKGILVMKSLADPRTAKRVSFADGYKPGQDSDTEAPPVRRRKKVRRVGCAWPCALSHPDHVPLWDALPPPPPPPGSPPPPPRRHPPVHMLREAGPRTTRDLVPPMPMGKFEPTALAAFMPPEPPPGLISF